jgi:hypothetical protein
VTVPAAPPPIEGLPEAARPPLELLARIHAEHGGRILLGDLTGEFLYSLAKDPPSSSPVRLGAAVAVRALRGGGARWPARVDPADPGLVREGYRLAALAVVALTSRTKVGLSGEDPDRRSLLEEWPADGDLVDGFMASEREILRRKGEPVPYPAADFLEDLHDVPARMLRPGPILPPETEATVAGPWRFTPNHDDRVVRMFDYFRDKYGSPRGERRAELYLAVLSFLARHRADLEAAGAVATDSGGRIAFRTGYLEGLLARPPGWFETA